MIQEIITYLIILASVSYAIYSIYRSISPLFIAKKAISCAGGCSGCSMSNSVQKKHNLTFKKFN